ncbi:unnamed protein product [Tuber melanosporum]|uniref:Vacuolar protein sorting/targeting protein 10 n=1 Tax=Tuber melanosporum (strain Mel28) TaxID=656061 RepID=D5GKL7_TUBMM|nr:uncharacterized protein GSTUM_00009633001 [Tuber melanosporum]CAZ85060.1 unnamed protein product [Tuber melanosporum]
MLLLRVWALAAAWLATATLAKKSPEISKTKLENLPSIFFYFDDSPVILTLDAHANNVWRSDDDGNSWHKVKGVPDGAAWDITEHPFDKKRAFIFGEDKEHWYTEDRGAKWHKFKSEVPLSLLQPPLVFHAGQPEWILYSGRVCEDDDDYFGRSCKEVTYYTKDGFDSEMKKLKEETHGCMFARGTPIFEGAKDETVLCIVNGDTAYTENRRLLVSHNWFRDSEEPKLDGYKTVNGLAGLAGIQKFIVAAVKTRGTDEMALYVTKDTKTWHRAEFPHDHGGLREDAYTVLESTPYSIQVDVLTTRAMNPMGSLFTSNSNGTYFTRNLDHTNRAVEGLVDFEQVANIQGIVLANVVNNADRVLENPTIRKERQSVISFDDGKWGTWVPLKGPDGKRLNLYSVTALADGGRIYSSPAPGILMGVGSLGDHLAGYKDCDLFYSDDAGLTWRKALTDAHKYEIGGSGSVMVAINDEDMTDIVSYSIDHGKNWEEVKLDERIRARLLTTTPDSTTLKFTLIGTARDKTPYVFGLDFSEVFERKCKLDKSSEDGDYEKWYARLDEEGKPDCLMGHKQYFWRRKPGVNCYVGEDYKDPEPEKEVCECTKHDFECDFNFVRENRGKDDDCVPAKGVKFSIPAGECKKDEDTYMGPSGYRKIPGNDCKGGESLEDKVERKCNEVTTTPSNGKVTDVKTSFAGKRVAEYFYLENAESASKSDETIIMRTEEQEVWITRDHGATWNRILEKVNVVSIYPNPNLWDSVYFITPDAEVWYTLDRGEHIKKMASVKTKPNRQGLQVIDFHPTKQGWLIWTGQEDCDSPSTCHSVAYHTKDNGEEWHRLLAYVGTCKWIRTEKQSEKLIFCEHFETERGNGEGNLELVASDNWFDDRHVKFRSIIGYATMAEFIIVASINEDGTSLKASASVNGSIFAEAAFPHNFNVPHQTAYTVLDSETHAVFLHVTVNPRKGFEFGSLLKSNSNGTNYVLSLDAVNRNEEGFVDFEKLKTLEGVAIANRVVNADKAVDGEKKRLRSMITHNDGATWDYILAPEKDADGKDHKICDTSDKKKCSLNLHHYTDRVDPRDTFGSGSAVGLMMGIGNIGDVLTGYKDGDTYLTRDGGVRWKQVKKGQYQWEYGDQGSIIVLVEDNVLTDRVHYSLDEGESWTEYTFAGSSDEKMRVADISTLPSDTSRKFILWGTREGDGNKFWTVQLDFTGLTDVKCDLKDGDGADSDDFELWSPEHQDGCLFGHRVQYNRKIRTHNCYIGRKIKQPHKILEKCKCTRHDYECDFNYQRDKDGACYLVEGLTPPDHQAVCKENKDQDEYWEPTGYRRIPMTTCEGGQELDKSISHYCPGHKKEWEKKHGGARGFALFLAIIAPITAAAVIGWFVWTRLLDGRFGAIRLGEDNNGQSPFVRYPIIVISAIVALAVSIPTILGAIGSWASSKLTRTRRYTSRSSFARGADYSVVNTDEGELLGSDDEDEF